MGLVRLFLAVVVAAGHWSGMVLAKAGFPLSETPLLGFNAGYAVMFFYVISGFLITYTLSYNYASDAVGAAAFYRNRFIRIFSLYWPLAIIALIAFPPAHRVLLSVGWVDRFTSLFLFGVDWRVSFGAPGGQYFGATMQGIEQSWTLGAELTFYLMAPFLMRSRYAAVALALASLAIRGWFVATMGSGIHAIWTYTFFPSTVVFFLFGHLIMRASRRWTVLLRPRLGLALVAASFLVMFFGRRSGFDDARLWTSILLFTVGLPGMFEATKDVRLLNVLADLSYPVYLVHALLMMVLGGYIQGHAKAIFGTMSWGASRFSLVEFLSLALVAAVAAHWLLERPCAAVLRAGTRWLANRPRAAPAAEGAAGGAARITG